VAEEAEEGGAAPAAAVAAVPKAVALAERLTAVRKATAEGVAQGRKAAAAKRKRAAVGPQPEQAAPATGGGKPGARPGQGLSGNAVRKTDPRLQVSRNAMKKQHKRGLVVIPQVRARPHTRSAGPRTSTAACTATAA
jgi:hypothetical protein